GLVRYVARTSVAEAFGLATSTKASNALVAPSARIQRSAACVTPLALCPPARVPSGKYIDRATTMSAGVDVPAFTAVTSADAEPFRPNVSPSATVARDVAWRRNSCVHGFPGSLIASLCGSRRTVTSTASLPGLPMRISAVNRALLAPSARNQRDRPWPDASAGARRTTRAAASPEARRRPRGRARGVSTTGHGSTSAVLYTLPRAPDGPSRSVARPHRPAVAARTAPRHRLRLQQPRQKLRQRRRRGRAPVGGHRRPHRRRGAAALRRRRLRHGEHRRGAQPRAQPCGCPSGGASRAAPGRAAPRHDDRAPHGTHRPLPVPARRGRTRRHG